jgi:acyl-coenzyme A thioesterase PaaI-like protein
MTVDVIAVAAEMAAAVPFARTLGIAVVDVTVDDTGLTAVATLPDEERLHNHVGGPHAGAIFTLGETASGAVVLAGFGAHLDRCTPLAVRADVTYLKLARGPLRATARLDRTASSILAELDAGARPEFPVTVAVTRADGAVTTQLTVVWTLRPNS